MRDADGCNLRDAGDLSNEAFDLGAATFSPPTLSMSFARSAKSRNPSSPSFTRSCSGILSLDAGGKRIHIPVHPRLKAELPDTGPTFFQTRYGRAFTPAGFTSGL